MPAGRVVPGFDPFEELDQILETTLRIGAAQRRESFNKNGSVKLPTSVADALARPLHPSSARGLAGDPTQFPATDPCDWSGGASSNFVSCGMEGSWFRPAP